jgi:CDP-diacylglycerol---serine O-phosphatidyltransferase
MRRKRTFEKNRLRRGIFLLPNIFTTINLFCGFYSIIASISGKFLAGAVAILIAGVFDWLDGKIARATNTTSKFGVEYDSLADLVSFGMAPGIMMYLWALQPLGRIGWLAAFLFMACGALRLARFNTQFGSISSKHFVGLPIPAAAGLPAVTVMLHYRLGMPGSANPVVMLLMLYILSFLMVSTIKYNSFKKPELFKKMNFNVLVSVILILIFIAAQPSIALFLFGTVYVASGPFTFVRRYRKPEVENSDTKKPDTTWASP